MNPSIYIAIFIILVAFGYLYRNLAWKQKIIDWPNQRSSHTQPVVRGGGILIFLPFTVWLLYLARDESPYRSLAAGFLLLSLLGFLDDKINLSPKIRFPVQLLGTALILQAAGLWKTDWPWYLKTLIFIVATGFINAYNFMDGINGITGLYTLVLTVSLWYLNRQTHLMDGTWFELLAVSVLAFGFFNFRKKALMFAGDIGTMSIASVLLYLMIYFSLQLNSPALLIIVTVYGIDSAMTIIRRIFKKENISQAHREHLYQKMVDKLEFSHLSVSILYVLIQTGLNFFFFQNKLWLLPIKTQFLSISIILVTFVVLYLIAQKYFDSWKA